jgi:hypothetical protein
MKVVDNKESDAFSNDSFNEDIFDIENDNNELMDC